MDRPKSRLLADKLFLLGIPESRASKPAAQSNSRRQFGVPKPWLGKSISLKPEIRLVDWWLTAYLSVHHWFPWTQWMSLLVFWATCVTGLLKNNTLFHHPLLDPLWQNRKRNIFVPSHPFKVNSERAFEWCSINLLPQTIKSWPQHFELTDTFSNPTLVSCFLIQNLQELMIWLIAIVLVAVVSSWNRRGSKQANMVLHRLICSGNTE